MMGMGDIGKVIGGELLKQSVEPEKLYTLNRGDTLQTGTGQVRGVGAPPPPANKTPFAAVGPDGKPGMFVYDETGKIVPVPGMTPYDHFRPYLYSTKLRYSFGSMKGRPREAWQQEIGKRSLEEAVAEIKKRGVAAIYINRNGFPDRALPIEKALRAMGYTKPPIVSATGDLVCIPLEKP